MYYTVVVIISLDICCVYMLGQFPLPVFADYGGTGISGGGGGVGLELGNYVCRSWSVSHNPTSN